MGKQKYDGIGTRKGISQNWSFDPDDLVIVGRDVEPDETNQHLYDPKRSKEEYDEGMVLSIMEHGNIVPIKVTMLGGRPHVVVGRGRTIAGREAKRRFREQGIEGLPRLTAVDAKGDKLKLSRHMVVENEIRRKDNPLNLARKLAGLQDLGASMGMLQKDTGLSARSITDRLKLLDLDTEVQEYVERGELSVEAAIQLVKKPVAEQRRIASLVAKPPGSPRVVVKKRGSKPTSRKTPATPPAASSPATPTGSKAAQVAKLTGNGRPTPPALKLVREVAEKVKQADGGEMSRQVAQAILWARGLAPTEEAPQAVREALK